MNSELKENQEYVHSPTSWEYDLCGDFKMEAHSWTFKVAYSKRTAGWQKKKTDETYHHTRATCFSAEKIFSPCKVSRESRRLLWKVAEQPTAEEGEHWEHRGGLGCMI